jgi:nucleoporin p58/p45
LLVQIPLTSYSSGLGGAQNQQSQPQPSSTFPTLNQNQGQGLFGSIIGGGLSLGQPTSQQQQTVPGVRIDVTNIRGTTRFNDLHEDLQKQISFLDDFIQAQIQLKNDCDAIMPSHESQLAQVPNDVEFCRRKLIGVENASDSDVQAISLAQRLVKTDAEHAKLSFKAIDNLKLPPQYHNPNIWSAKASSGDSRVQSNGESEAQDIVGFFSTTADELATTLSNYQKHITEIEQHLRGVEANSAQQINILVAKRNGSLGGQDDPMDQLTGALRDFEESILGVAGKVGGAREGVQSLQLGRFTARLVNSSKGHRSGVY